MSRQPISSSIALYPRLMESSSHRKDKVKEKKEMAGHDQRNKKSRVVKIDTGETWDLVTAKARSQGCPVAVHFTASWCMPSVAMNPLFEGLALSYQDVLFLLVDVDEVKEVASKMEIKAMPTFVLMREGEQVDKLVGANPDEIRKRIHGFARSFVHVF
ncbi:Monodehydroascorbate reductase (NADH) [Bertholletia excelsa]